MGILDQSKRIESGRHSKLYYGLKDFGDELKDASPKILKFLSGMGFLIFLAYHMSDINKGINEISESMQLKVNNDIKINVIVTGSTDCNLLQQNILDLISKGANAESWLPNQYDSDLKIGKERYSVLGCKP